MNPDEKIVFIKKVVDSFTHPFITSTDSYKEINRILDQNIDSFTKLFIIKELLNKNKFSLFEKTDFYRIIKKIVDKP